MAYLLGIDVSTTATKALLIDEQGAVVAVGATEYSYDTPQPLERAGPARLVVWRCPGIRQALETSGIKGEEIAAIGLTGQMRSRLAQRRRLVLRPSILWNDQRTRQCDEIRKASASRTSSATRATMRSPASPRPRFVGARARAGGIRRVRHILLPKDYLRYRLTGEMGTDKAVAAGTLLLDLRTPDWSTEVLQALDIPRISAAYPRRPRDHGPGDGVRRCRHGPQGRYMVVAGGGDQAAGAVGVGAVTGASSAWCSAHPASSSPRSTSRSTSRKAIARPFCTRPLALMGVMLSAAGSLRWYRDTLAPGMSYDDLLAPAADVPPGSGACSSCPTSPASARRTPTRRPRRGSSA